MKMADCWSNDFVLKFLKHYRNEPVIWDPSHVAYKDKKKKYNAWLRLSTKLNRPVSELKKKKDSLMATFRGHLRKKKKLIMSAESADATYRPIWFAYKVMESFLAPTYKGPMTTNTWENMDEPFADGTSDDEENEGSGRVTGNISPVATISTQHRTNTNPPELQKATDHMKQAFNLLNNAINKRVPDKEEDECDLFGKMLAKKLRRLPENEREIFMYKIDGMFVNKIHRDNAVETACTASNTEFSCD